MSTKFRLNTMQEQLDVLAAMKAGKTIQFRSSQSMGWHRFGHKWGDMGVRPTWSSSQFRIKPDPIKVKYKRVLLNWAGEYQVAIWYDYDCDADKTPAWYFGTRFVKMIDTEWQEYEYTPGEEN